MNYISLDIFIKKKNKTDSNFDFIHLKRRRVVRIASIWLTNRPDPARRTGVMFTNACPMQGRYASYQVRVYSLACRCRNIIAQWRHTRVLCKTDFLSFLCRRSDYSVAKIRRCGDGKYVVLHKPYRSRSPNLEAHMETQWNKKTRSTWTIKYEKKLWNQKYILD